MTPRIITVGLLFLASIAATRPSVRQEDGKTLYDEHCMKCHGVRGLPPKTMKAKYPKIATFDAAFIASRTDDSIVKILTKGKNDDMVSFKDKLKPEEMVIIAKYVRALASKMKPGLVVLMAALSLAPAVAQAQQPTAPLAPGYAGSATCIQCHKKEVAEFTTSAPAGTLNPTHLRTSHQKLACESCHGPSKQHVNSGAEERGGLISYAGRHPSPVAQRNANCLGCHEKTARTLWKGSAHEARNVACSDCHTLMHSESERGNLKKSTVLETCGRCHAQRKAQQMRFSHMPIGEGKMECTSCHNPHGSANEKLLIASSVNETCFTCHAEKRGPFLWEHAPVVENCANCHDSHGSNKEKMLKVARPRLCQQCHAGTGHPTQPRIVGRPADVPFVFNRACSNCHFNIHGSNHPAGAFFTR